MDQVEAISRSWIDKFVIRHNLCPFAAKPISEDRVSFKLISFEQPELLLSTFHGMIANLLQASSPEQTGFIIIEKGLENFMDYLDVLEILESALASEEIEDAIQIASFHPDYCFEGNEKDAVENYTNRSPYPMFHLLKVDDVEQAIEAYGDTSVIPENNMKTLGKLGLEEVLKQLQSIKDSAT